MGKNKFEKQYTRGQINEKTSFVNPYNFVSIRKKRADKHKKEKEEILGKLKEDTLYTGYLVCRLKNKTPLAIPDAAARQLKNIEGNYKHYKYPHFSLDAKTPVIPGSSIRGTIRSIYETVTDSCMVTVRENMGISKRTEAIPSQIFAPGLLIKENDTEGNLCWRLYKAKRYIIPMKEYNRKKEHTCKYSIKKIGNVRFIVENPEETEMNQGFRNGECVKITYNNKNKITSMEKSQDGMAYVYIGEEFINGKKGESVFEKDGEVKKGNSDSAYTPEEIKGALSGLEETLKTYRNPSVNKGYERTHFGYEDYEYAKEKGVIPLWYKKEGKRLYFSMAAIGRRQYQKTLVNLIGDMSPCKNRSELCKACQLFGMSAGSEAMGSRVRFSDAVVAGEYDIKENVTLKELGAPRSSYLPFYSKDGKEYDKEGAQIRGRKFYWHNPEAEKESFPKEVQKQESEGRAVYEAEYQYTQYEEDKKNGCNIDEQKIKEFERNATHDLIQPNAEFIFNVYYDGITKTQLKELVWALTLGENREDGMRCHKIGHGKPLGLGSVKIIIEKNVMRTIDNSGYRLKTIYMGEKTKPFEEKDNCVAEQEMVIDEKDAIIQQLLKISDYQALYSSESLNQGNPCAGIRYPYVELDEDTIKDIQKGNLKEYNGYLPGKNDCAPHKWFYKNRQELEKEMREINSLTNLSKEEKKKKIENVLKKYTLPTLDTDSNLDNQKLPIYRLTVTQKQNSDSGNHKNNKNNKNNKNSKNNYKNQYKKNK